MASLATAGTRRWGARGVLVATIASILLMGSTPAATEEQQPTPPDASPTSAASPDAADLMTEAMPAPVAEQMEEAAAAEPAPARIALTGFVWVQGRFTTVAAPQAEGTITLTAGNGQQQVLSGTMASGINDDGKVVGSYVAGGTGHGFLLDDGEYTTIDVPGALSTVVLDINNQGEILGQTTDSEGRPLAFVRSPRGRYRTFDVPGPPVSGVHRMNDRRQITGVFVYPDEVGAPVRQGHGFLLDDGELTTFDAPEAGPLTDPAGINNWGVIVGAYDDADVQTHGFVRSRRGRITTLDVAGASYTALQANNDHGDIVAQYADRGDISSADRAHGVLLPRGRNRGRTVIDVPGQAFTAPSDINDRDRVAGFAYNIS